MIHISRKFIIIISLLCISGIFSILFFIRQYENPKPLIGSTWLGPVLPCSIPDNEPVQVQFDPGNTYYLQIGDVGCFGEYHIVDDDSSVLELHYKSIITRYTYKIRGDTLTLYTADGEELVYTWQPNLICKGSMCY